MTSTLSPSALHRIFFLVKNDDRPSNEKKKTLWEFAADAGYTLQKVNSKWAAVYELYMETEPAPPLDYLHSFELTLVLKGDVDEEDVRAIFAHGKPLVFWGCPQLLVSKTVAAFRELLEEPTYLDVAATTLHVHGAMTPSEAWSEVYTTHLPCHACTTVATVEQRSISRPRYSLVENTDFVAEKFHISSKNFGKRLMVELLFEEGTSRTQSPFVHRIIIRLADEEACLAKVRLPATVNRSSATLMLLPDFAFEVFGFLDRAHVGSSLLANSDLHDLICELKQRLPVHHLECRFNVHTFRREQWYGGAYCVEIGHVQRDLPYTDVRRFDLPSIAGAENDCALIRHYLSNSHAGGLVAPTNDPDFTMMMLASLAACNFSVGRLELETDGERLSDYRSMEAVFGGMRLGSLNVTMAEHHFLELVHSAHFSRMPTVQRLRELKLTLSHPRTEEDEPRGHAISTSPLWLPGSYLLPNCKYYQVVYRPPTRHLRPIELEVVRICEEFERGEITDTVEHFQLKMNSSQGTTYALNRENLLVARMKVKGTGGWARVNDVEWDVYRFRNARNGEYLTACVGRRTSASMLHIMKGEIFPDASFYEGL